APRTGGSDRRTRSPPAAGWRRPPARSRRRACPCGRRAARAARPARRRPSRRSRAGTTCGPRRAIRVVRSRDRGGEGRAGRRIGARQESRVDAAAVKVEFWPRGVLGTERVHGVMPAAGVGQRLAAGLPKQYLPILDAPMIVHTARALLAAAWIDELVIVVAPDDAGRAASLFQGWSRVRVRAIGGASRRDSVLAG